MAAHSDVVRVPSRFPGTEDPFPGSQVFFYSSVFLFFLDERFETDTVRVHKLGPAKNEMSNLLLGASLQSSGRALFRLLRLLRSVRIRLEGGEPVVEAPPGFVELPRAKCQTSVELARGDDPGLVVLLETVLIRAC